MVKDVCYEKKSKKQILKEECEFIRLIEKDIASNEALKNLGYQRMLFQRGWKQREASLHCKKLYRLSKVYVAVTAKEVDKAVYDWFNL